MSLKVGRHHALVIKDGGDVWAWGANTWGELGVGGPDLHLLPCRVPLDGKALLVATGANHSLVIREDGTLLAFGQNAEGQLGIGEVTTDKHSVALPVPLTHRVTLVVANGWHSLAMMETGEVFSWGLNGHGQLGQGVTVERCPTPAKVQLPGRAVDMAAGYDHGLAVIEDGSVYTWGSNEFGQLGTGSLLPSKQHSPTKVVGLPGRVKVVTAGAFHSLAIIDGPGSVMAWGWNKYGQLGVAEAEPEKHTRPAHVKISERAVGLAAGEIFSVALLTNGRVMSWGRNSGGQLGTGTNTDLELQMPTEVCIPHSEFVKAVAAGWYNGFAQCQSGRLYCWGENFAGQLGNGSVVPKIQPLPTICCIPGSGGEPPGEASHSGALEISSPVVEVRSRETAYRTSQEGPRPAITIQVDSLREALRDAPLEELLELQAAVSEELLRRRQP